MSGLIKQWIATLCIISYLLQGGLPNSQELFKLYFYPSVNKGIKIIRSLNSLLQDKSLRKITKKSVYKTVVRSVMINEARSVGYK